MLQQSEAELNKLLKIYTERQMKKSLENWASGDDIYNGPGDEEFMKHTSSTIRITLYLMYLNDSMNESTAHKCAGGLAKSFV